MKILGFYISRTDWEKKRNDQIKFTTHWRDKFFSQNEAFDRIFSANKETYTDKTGRLRYKINGQFASKKDITTQQLRDEVDDKHVINWGDLKQATRDEEFGR